MRKTILMTSPKDGGMRPFQNTASPQEKKTMYMKENTYITVPKNPKGYEEYDFGYEHTENMEEWILSKEE